MYFGCLKARRTPPHIVGRQFEGFGEIGVEGRFFFGLEHLHYICVVWIIVDVVAADDLGSGSVLGGVVAFRVSDVFDDLGKPFVGFVGVDGSDIVEIVEGLRVGLLHDGFGEIAKRWIKRKLVRS